MRAWYIFVFVIGSHSVAIAQDTLCSAYFASGAYIQPGGDLEEDRFFNSLDDVAFIPLAWRNLTRKIDYPVTKNLARVHQLQQTYGGQWRKVYHLLRDGREFHYFEDLTSGAVYDPKWK